MSEPQTFDPTQTFTVVQTPQGPHPEAKIGAPRENEPVTLGDVMDNPREAMSRIGASLKRDVSDPHLWLALAASYFGPKAFNAVGPAVARAASGAVKGTIRGAAAVGDAISPDVVGIVSPRAGKALQVAQRVRDALPVNGAPAAQTPPPVAAPPATLPVAAPPPTAAAAGAPAAMPTEVGAIVKALADEGFSGSEIEQSVKWLKAGVDPKTVWQRIQDTRALTSKVSAFSKLPSNEAVAAEIQDRGPSNRSPQRRP